MSLHYNSTRCTHTHTETQTQTRKKQSGGQRTSSDPSTSSRTRRRPAPKRRELVPLLRRAHRDSHRVQQVTRRPPRVCRARAVRTRPRARLRLRLRVGLRVGVGLRVRVRMRTGPPILLARPRPPATHRRLQRAGASRSSAFPSGERRCPRVRRLDVLHRRVALLLPLSCAVF